MRRRRPASRGFALIAVLWTVAILALLTAHLIGAARQRAGAATSLRDNARLEAAADGAVFDTILWIFRQGGTAGIPKRALAIGGIPVDVGLRDEATRLNLNTTSVAALQNLLLSIDVDPSAASRLARSIVDWRTRAPESMLGLTKIEQYQNAGLRYLPPNQPFASVEELGLVLGMTPEIYTRLKPFISVVREEGHAPVEGSLDQTSPAAEPGGPAHANTLILANTVYQIDAMAHLPNGTRFGRRAIVRIKMAPEPGVQPYEVLVWETPND